MSWIGFSVRVTWSGFPIPVYGADVADQGLVTCWIGDPAPLTRDSGWRARHDLASGLADTYLWYRDAGWL